MTARKVTVDGFTYKGTWLSKRRIGALIVSGPLEYERPVRGTYSDGEWSDDSGHQGRPETVRYRRWWKAAWQLAHIYDTETGGATRNEHGR